MFVRINPDEKDFSVYDGLGKIQTFIDKLKDEELEKLKDKIKELKKDKESTIDKISKRLLQLGFKSNHSIISKCLNGLSETFYQITKNGQHTIKNKSDKNWKTTWNNVFLEM